jgi:uncharacterized protein (TIGR01244 family)
MEEIRATQIGSTKPVHLCGKIYLAGQPSPDDLKEAQRQGARTVVSLREKSELNWDEAQSVQQLGMRYHHVPFKSPASLTDQVFDEVRRLLSDAEQQPVVLHCGSANRVGAVWIPFRVLDQGATWEQALAEAKTIGLRMPEYEARAKAYVEARQGGK